MSFLPFKTKAVLLRTFLVYGAVSLVLLMIPARVTGPVGDIVLFPWSLLQRGVLRVVHGIGSIGGAPGLDREAAAEIETLRDRANEFEARLRLETHMRREAEAALAQVAEVPAEIPRPALPAHVVSFAPDPLRRVAVLDRGSRTGVAPGCPLLWFGSVIGRIESVTPLRSRAALIGDSECRIAVQCLRTRVAGVLEGIGGGVCAVKYIDRTARNQLEVGDIFVTSGYDNIFPPGQQVGICSKVRASGEVFLYVEVTPSLEISRLKDVVILLPNEPDKEGVR